MPMRPLRPCPKSGCLTLGCTEHRTEAFRIDQIARGTSHQRGYDRDQHRPWRARILARDRWCKDPDRRHPGERRPATVADHIVPVTRGGIWSDDNGQGLCRSCHNAKTAKERGR
jgi:5-methylcytosine-specific restriction protein A